MSARPINVHQAKYRFTLVVLVVVAAVLLMGAPARPAWADWSPPDPGQPLPPELAYSSSPNQTAVSGRVLDIAELTSEFDTGGPTITLDVRQADLRDVLSALAIKMGVQVILTAEPVPVSFAIRDVYPVQALELFLQSQGLAYIRHGNLIVVGTPDKLQSDFFKQMIITRFNLSFVTVDQVQPLIGQLGLPVEILALDTNPRAFWAQGTPPALHKLRELLLAVDLPENHTVTLEYRAITVTQISPSRLAELLGQIGITPARTVILGNRLLVFDTNVLARWEQVQALVSQLDTQDARNETLFVYPLKNIVARDAAARLAQFSLPGVKTTTFNYPEFARELIVICPPEQATQVRNILAGLDRTQQKIRVPVASAEGKNAHQQLNARRHLLSELTDVPIGNMRISSNLSGDSENPHYVLWVEETPDKIQVIEDLIKRM